jgi:hypothetical protein
VNRCPSQEQLAQLLEESLESAERAPLEEHVEQCSPCQAALEQLTASDSPTAVPGADERPADAEASTFLARLQGQREPAVALRRRAGDASDTTQRPGPGRDANPQRPARLHRLPQVPGYEVLGLLGRGGMGVVYKARHLRLRRLVALKMIADRVHSDPEYLARFRLEAEAVARLQHPNIIQIYEIGEADGSPYIALELVEGGSLAARAQRAPQPPAEAARLVATLARAVHHAHRQGVLHRDLKPANILLVAGNLAGDSPAKPPAAEPVPKIADFGLAKCLDAGLGGSRAATLTTAGDIIGTPGYLAPEQVAAGSAPVGPAADVWALGAILYELLTGRPPFQGATPLESLLQTQSEEPVPPTRLQSRLPLDLETICLQCLHKDPRRRYGSAADLADDLRRFLGGESILARPVGPLGRAAKWARRRPAVTALLAALAAVTLAAFGLVTWQWREADYQHGLADLRADGEEKARRLAEQRGRDEAQARRAAERLSAGALLDRGTAQCDRGEAAEGLLWLTRGLDLAVRAGDADLERAVRLNLTGWRSRLIRPAARLVHTDWAWAVAFSPDGKTAATGSKDQTARLWDAATGQPLGEPLRHAFPVWAIAFSPDGTTLLTCACSPDGRQGEARLWAVGTGRPLSEPLPLSGRVRTAGLSAQGRRWLGWLRHARLTPFRAAAFSNDGRTLLTATAGEVRLWSTADRRPLGPPLPHPGVIMTAAFSRDGTAVVTCGADGTARLWDTATGQARGSPLAHQGPVEAAAFSPDGQTLATGNWVEVKDGLRGLILHGGEVRLWRWETGAPVGEPLACGGRVLALAFGADGRKLAAGGALLGDRWKEDNTYQLTGEARLWQAPAAPPGGSPSRRWSTAARSGRWPSARTAGCC